MQRRALRLAVGITSNQEFIVSKPLVGEQLPAQ